jgi:penicillin amidase
MGSTCRGAGFMLLPLGPLSLPASKLDRSDSKHFPRGSSVLKKTLFVFSVFGFGFGLAACSSNSTVPVTPSNDAGTSDAADAQGPAPDPAQQIPLTRTITAPGLSAPVDVVRDQWGIPHIYGTTLPDVAYAEGYTMASDRMVEMDLGRAQAEGTLAAFLGEIAPSLLQADIQMRLHHMKETAQTAFTQLEASSDPNDKNIVQALTMFAGGVNAWLADVKSGKVTFPPEVMKGYRPQSTNPWTEVDSIALSYLQAFELAFDADTEMTLTQIDAQGAAIFDDATDPALKARKGIAKDFELYQPFDPTFTLPSGWTGFNGDNSTALYKNKQERKKLLTLLEQTRRMVQGVGDDHRVHESRGSNNFIIGPKLSQTGNVLVANDTHLSLSNPPIFYLVHLVVSDKAAPVDAIGVNFPGIPGIVLGSNEHIAWGATVNNIDVTDVYQETIVPCAGTAPCVKFNGKAVATVPRVETFQIGFFNNITSTAKVTYYDVPQHGPIIPRFDASGNQLPLGTTEMSIKYTGYEPAQLLRGVLGVVTASTMQDAVKALDRDFKYGGQNWVIGDDQGNFGWTQTIRVPRRAKGFAPYKVLPGDGTAEWGPDMDPKYIPHSYNPKAGFLATANGDPIGVTAKNDPFFSQPMVDGSPLYLGFDYDPGTRVGRITKRIQAMTAGGKKLAQSDIPSIQADIVSEYAQAFAPTFISTAADVAAEIVTPGSHPALSAIVTAADATAKGLVSQAHDIVAGWTSFNTSSGVILETTPADVADSQATLLHAVWLVNLKHLALDDEITKLGVTPNDDMVKKLLAVMINKPSSLATGVSSATGDALLFDDLTTSPIESKEQISASALFAALDYLVKTLGADVTTWRWGSVHTLTLGYLTGIDGQLNLPPTGDKTYPNGYPRHGDDGTVDVGYHGFSLTDFTYDEGPAIRFACEVAPGAMHPMNVLPGGETMDPSSPHYQDQAALWLKNQAFDLAFYPADVVASAKIEYAANKDGRVTFSP